jgi:hypothetical protein
MATKSPSRIRRSPRPIADHLETGHDILCELTAEAHALGVLGQLADVAQEHGSDFSADVLISMNRLMAPHVREIERQLTRLDETLLALSCMRKAA